MRCFQSFCGSLLGAGDPTTDLLSRKIDTVTMVPSIVGAAEPATHGGFVVNYNVGSPSTATVSIGSSIIGTNAGQRPLASPRLICMAGGGLTKWQ